MDIPAWHRSNQDCVNGPSPGTIRLQVKIVIFVLLLGVTGCGQEDRQRGPGGFQRPPTLVVTVPAQQREIREYLEAIGTAMANESVILTAKVTDTVSHVRFDDGDLVQAGAVLVELTDAEEAALLREAEANVTDTRLQFERLDNLFNQGSVPLSQVDEARARFDAAQARQQSLLARLNDRLIRAPFTGLLGFRQISEGTLLTPTTPITTLDDVSIIKLDFSVPEVNLGMIQPGQELVAISPTYPDTAFPATVRTIGSRVDPVTRAATIRAHIDNQDLRIRPGMLMTVRLTTSTRSALMVPERSLLQRSNDMYVYTVNDGRAALIEIQAGTQNQGWVEVISGLEAGTEVVTDGVIKLRDQAPVRIQGQTPDRPNTVAGAG